MNPPGKLFVVGLGPGDRSLLTPQALETLRQADAVVGYTGYFSGLEDLLAGKECLALPLAQETERARRAVQLAREGRTVCVISSGDPGVYAMASLVLEVVAEDEASERLEVVVVPGVSAVQACASLLGAPIGHDFAVLSLSDLLTPWEQIERRLHAAAEADFALALLNPKSVRRDWQYPRAQAILLRYRSPQTPVGVVRKAYRPEQAVTLTTLGEMTQVPVDMFTTVIVGNSQTRRLGHTLVTPRGYTLSGTKPEEARQAVTPAHQSVSDKPEAPAKGASLALQACGELSCQDNSAVPLPGPAAELRQMASPGEILAESFAIIDREVGPHSFGPLEWSVVRRMIHASGDLEIVKTVCFHRDAVTAGLDALRRGVPLVTDVSMVAAGINKQALQRLGLVIHCYIDDAEVREQAERSGRTRSHCAMEKARRAFPEAVYVVGNAPTALFALCDAVRRGTARPSLVVALPVGFVAVVESKEEALALEVPVITARGRKGGSAMAAAAVNAILYIVSPM